ncbi:Wadjet anti-phage system protein JetD domain-containing protein [Duganella sp. BuS-21]|uniref:Wadjet anti-phage system protein JetD domain-containing protein n=1 Tax=Duganella sp. BuS-21 TaxID=2943848 RepID=UPI0035A63523
MKLPSEVRQWLTRRYAGQHRLWLSASDSQSWPLRIMLGLPTEAEALRQPEAVRAWADSWRAPHGPGELEWVDRRWKVLGNQRLPQALVLADAAQAAAWAGELERWQRAVSRSAVLLQHWPALAAISPRLFDVLADYAELDLQRLQDLLAWLLAHPATGMYPRQLPIAGLDSKWLEPRIAIVASMLATVRGGDGDGVAGADAYTMCGLKRPPATLRIRVLDPALRAVVGGLGDLNAPIDMLARLPWRPDHVLIVENLQTGLALEDLPGTVAVIGLGYAVDVLARLPWAAQANCRYWGDIDTHGYAILHQARTALPHLNSVMMDDATLHRFRDLWSSEGAQSAAAELPGLTPAEHAVYDGLRRHAWGQGVRLEQERISWDYAWSRLSGI